MYNVERVGADPNYRVHFFDPIRICLYENLNPFLSVSYEYNVHGAFANAVTAVVLSMAQEEREKNSPAK